MATKTKYICDCCYREADTDFGWARIAVVGDNQISSDQHLDLCEICWGPLDQMVQTKGQEAREKPVKDA